MEEVCSVRPSCPPEDEDIPPGDEAAAEDGPATAPPAGESDLNWHEGAQTRVY